MKTAVSTVVLEYARVLAIVLVSLSIGWVLSRMPVAAARRIGPWAELAGTVIIAWMGLARLGWPIQTWGGGSYAEWLNDAIFRWGTIAGLVLLFVRILPQASPRNVNPCGLQPGAIASSWER